MSVGRIVLWIVSPTVVGIVVFMSMGRRDLAGAVMAIGLILAFLVPTIVAAARRRLGVAGLVVAAIGVAFGVGLLLPALYGKRSPTGELGFGIVIGCIVAAIVGVFLMLPIWVQLRTNHELRRTRAATSILRWPWSWRISQPSGDIDGVRVTLTGRGITAGLSVPMSFTSGLKAFDLATLAHLGPRSRLALEALERHDSVTAVAAERGVATLTLGPEVDGNGMAAVACALAEVVSVIAAEAGPEATESDMLVLFRRAAERLRDEGDPIWRLTGLEALIGFAESPALGGEVPRLEAKRVLESLVGDIGEDDPHPRVALLAARMRGDAAAVGRIRARLGHAGGELAIAGGAPSGLSLFDEDSP